MDLPELQGEPEDIAKAKAKLAAKDIGGKDPIPFLFTPIKTIPLIFLRAGGKGLVGSCVAGNDATFWSRSIEGAGDFLRARRPRRETNSEAESHAAITCVHFLTPM